ncbi:hypothetical protein B0A50_03984 [Salinomyces thailandicus]|uniref:Rhodopsin domain-containing protein n=1 Tax=Salinomyces thailandicus TaxID=706561 RepID=A0A4V5N534_9PEZI|nr:hypothetical protein B0A50_03984 [Salinomyces thailandica]
MSDSITPCQRRFRIEAWTEFGLGVLAILIRIAAKLRKHGDVRRLLLEDWISLQIIVWYTLLAIAIHNIVFGGGSNFMTSKEEAALTPETKAERIRGSKWVLVSEQAMVMSVWSCKAIMLIAYRTITHATPDSPSQSHEYTADPFRSGLKRERWINAIASYWNFEYVEGFFNVSADVFVLLAAIPVVATVRLPWLQKAPLLVVFGLGIAVIAAAVLTKVYCLVPSLLSYEYLAWYHREVMMSIVVTMLPVIWSFLRELIPALQQWGYRANQGTPTTCRQGGPDSSGGVELRSRRRRSGDDLRMSDSEEEFNTASSISRHSVSSIKEENCKSDSDTRLRPPKATVHR